MEPNSQADVSGREREEAPHSQLHSRVSHVLASLNAAGWSVGRGREQKHRENTNDLQAHISSSPRQSSPTSTTIMHPVMPYNHSHQCIY